MKKENFKYIKTNNSLTINYDGNTVTFPSNDPRFNKVWDCIKNEDWASIPALMNPASQIKVYSGGRMKLDNGQVYINDRAVPSRLNSRIIAFMNANEPFEILVNFFERLLQNPSYRSVDQLFDFLEANHFPLHQDGRFLAYKGVRNDYKDLHSGTFDNSPGKIVKMNRNEVDEDPNKTCSKGLHVASYSYAHNFSNGQRVVEVLVDPKDVVAVPKDHNDAKMRVCEYLVIGDSKGERPKTEQVVKMNKSKDDSEMIERGECEECGQDIDDDNYCIICETCLDCCNDSNCGCSDN